MKSRREFWSMLILVSIGLIASLLQARSAFGQAANAAPQPRGAAGPDALRRGALEVWVPKSHVMGLLGDPTARVNHVYQWEILLNEFKADFPDCDLRCKILDRDEFVRTFHSSQQNPPYPDVAFVDNYNELGPLVNDDAVVTMSGQSRFPFNGSWVVFRRAENFEAGKAFMLWLSQSPRWQPWQVSTPAIGPADIAAVQAISKEAVQDFKHPDTQSLSLIMDREAGHFYLGFGPATTLESVDPLLTFGNSRLAFVLLSAVGQGEKTFGMDHSAVALRKVEDRWKVLLFLPGALPDLEGLLRSFDRLRLEDGQPESVPKVRLLSPVDHARIPRYPPGDLEWAPLDQLPAAYVIEYQFGQTGSSATRPGARELWSPSWIRVVSPTHGEPSIRMKIPFGKGAQPHRWRVWAISGTGIVSTSDWRIIDFTN